MEIMIVNGEKENKKAEARSYLTASAHRSLSSFSSINYSKKQTYRKQEKCSKVFLWRSALTQSVHFP